MPAWALLSRVWLDGWEHRPIVPGGRLTSQCHGRMGWAVAITEWIADGGHRASVIDYLTRHPHGRAALKKSAPLQ